MSASWFEIGLTFFRLHDAMNSDMIGIALLHSSWTRRSSVLVPSIPCAHGTNDILLSPKRAEKCPVRKSNEIWYHNPQCWCNAQEVTTNCMVVKMITICFESMERSHMCCQLVTRPLRSKICISALPFKCRHMLEWGWLTTRACHDLDMPGGRYTNGENRDTTS